MNCNQTCRLSNVTADYLATFGCILESMIQDMTNVRLTNSISYNFIVQMIPHHRAAIEMSRNLLKYTTFLPLQDMASQIIAEQTRSIEHMRTVLCICGQMENCESDLCRYEMRVQKILDVMFSGMEHACASNHLNTNFIREMLPHHRGAVEMSENALQYDICPELKPILEAIITSQKREICQMQKLLRCMNLCS